MKLTKSQVRQIIREELMAVLRENPELLEEGKWRDWMKGALAAGALTAATLGGPSDAYGDEPASDPVAAATDVMPGEADLGAAGNNIMLAWKAYEKSGKGEKEKDDLIKSIINVMKQGKKDGIKYDKGKAKEILDSEYWTNAESKIKSFLASGHTPEPEPEAQAGKKPVKPGSTTAKFGTDPDDPKVKKMKDIQKQMAGAGITKEGRHKRGKMA